MDTAITNAYTLYHDKYPQGKSNQEFRSQAANWW